MSRRERFYNIWRGFTFAQRRWNVFLGLFFLSIGFSLLSVFFQRRSSPGVPIISQDEQILWSPHLNAVNAKGDEYSIYAKKMIYGEKSGYVFDNIDAFLSNKEEGGFFLSAKKGVYRDNERVFLQGDVCACTKSGWRIKTQSAVFFLEKSRVEGEEYVEGAGPFGTFSANGFSLEDTCILLKKNAEVVITTEDGPMPVNL